MAIGTCPTTGEACNHIPAFPEGDYVAPEFTKQCKPRTEDMKWLMEHCGYYVELADHMKATATQAVEGEI